MMLKPVKRTRILAFQKDVDLPSERFDKHCKIP